MRSAFPREVAGMDWKTVVTRESAVMPGVRFRLRPMSYGRRVRLNLALAEYRARIRELNREREPLRMAWLEARDRAQKAAEPEVQALVAAGQERAVAEAAVALRIDFPADQAARMNELWADSELLDQEHLAPARIRVGFAGIEGYTIDGKAPDAELLLAEGDEALVAEIAEACKTLEGMTPDEQGNWQWPTTSALREGGPASDIAATPAAPDGTT